MPATDRRARATAALERVGMRTAPSICTASSPAGSNSVWPPPGPWQVSPPCYWRMSPRSLDSKSGEAVMELLHELHRAGVTICMVTHDPHYARHAERNIHLFDGRVVEQPLEMAAS